MPLPNIDRSLQAGILANLKETWQQTMPTFENQQDLFIYKLPYTNIRNATYVWKESLPFPELWPYGKGRQYKSFKDRYITLNKVNYELSIPWSKFDEEDDQLGDLRTHINKCVERYGLLPIVLLYEYFNGVAVMNPSLKTAYDGASLFSATDGDGNARLGVTGGNIVTGSGLTVAGIIHDFAVAQQRYMSMVDPTAGKPIFSEEDVSYNKMVAIIPIQLNEIFQKATNAEMIRIDSSNNTSESNYLKGTFEYRISPFLTDTSDWYICLKNKYWKPFVYVSPQNIETVVADINNSDHAREYNEYAIYTHIRSALGMWFPGTIMKINN